LKPEYNINQKATAPMSGRTHSDESKQIMSDNKKGEKNPMFGQNHSYDTKQIMSDNNKGENNPMFGSNLSNETRKKNI
jgi:group I intron endonuclease